MTQLIRLSFTGEKVSDLVLRRKLYKFFTSAETRCAQHIHSVIDSLVKCLGNSKLRRAQAEFVSSLVEGFEYGWAMIVTCGATSRTTLPKGMTKPQKVVMLAAIEAGANVGRVSRETYCRPTN